jgi:hypothetical protein
MGVGKYARVASTLYAGGAHHEEALMSAWQRGRWFGECIEESLQRETSERPPDALSADVPSDHPVWGFLELPPRAVRGLVMVNL